MINMPVIATDLDRTLLPNGSQEYDGSMAIFCEIIRNERLNLIYATGRNLELVQDAIAEFRLPYPELIVGEVGTKIYSRRNQDFVEDYQWTRQIRSLTKNWNVDKFKEKLSLLNQLRIQERNKENEFKLSYYLDDPRDSSLVIKKVTEIIKLICQEATVVYSVDETRDLGLLDILPRRATKLAALEYLRKKLGLDQREIIYCGDSGNDTLPLTFGYKSIIVRNAVSELKNTVRRISTEKNIIDKLYIARGYKKLNGYYVSGIIEGLIKFNVISPLYAG